MHKSARQELHLHCKQTSPVSGRVFCVCIFFFFFSSRRRHTRWNCDWSSDVCSSDLYHTVDWHEQNSSLFKALSLEKLGMSVILSLIVIVAAFNIVSTLTMVVGHKTRESGILKAMGLPSASVRRIFLAQGLVIGVV